MSRYLLSLIFSLGLGLSINAQDNLVTASVYFDNIEQKAIILPVPKFPDAAMQFGLGGNLSVSIKLDKDGNVTTAEFSSGPGTICKSVADPNVVELRNLAIEAAKGAKFEPLANSEDLDLSAQIVYHFPFQENAPNRPVVYGMLNHQPAKSHEHAVPLPKPVFPLAARAVRASGPVDVRVAIDDTGRVFTAEVVSGHLLLRAASIAAACEAKFAPTLFDGKPVWITGIVTYKFTP